MAGHQSFTSNKTIKLAIFAAFVWFCAALFIRFVGPRGWLTGLKGLVLYAATIPATIPLNARTLKIAGLTRADIVPAVATTAATATLLDGLAMSCFPGLYGPDTAVMGEGAIWLLWAIGVGLALALFTASRMRAAD